MSSLRRIRFLSLAALALLSSFAGGCAFEAGAPGDYDSVEGQVASIIPAPLGGECGGGNDLVAASVEAFVDSVPHSNTVYTPISDAARDDVAEAARLLVVLSDFDGAELQLAGTGYELRTLSLPTECLWVLRPVPGGPFEGIQSTLLVRPTYWTDNLMIEVPHARPRSASGSSGDYLTKEEGAILFDTVVTGLVTVEGTPARPRSLRPHALLLSGSHRCVDMQPAVPNICGGGGALGGYGNSPPQGCPSGDYLASDVAHAETNTFFAIHRDVLHSAGDGIFPNTIIALQLHTNGSQNANGVARVSDGTTEDLTPGGGLEHNVIRFRNHLDAARIHEGLVGNVYGCNDPGDNQANMLCGTKNSESVVTPNPANSCTNGAVNTSTGRFIHLEQRSMKWSGSDATHFNYADWTAVVARAIVTMVWNYDPA